MLVLRTVPVSLMAITLYLQPVLGVVWGHAFLGEAVSWSTLSGAALILGAVWFGSRKQ
jgi:LPXTG-motif cell wall-anchored protein